MNGTETPTMPAELPAQVYALLDAQRAAGDIFPVVTIGKVYIKEHMHGLSVMILNNAGLSREFQNREQAVQYAYQVWCQLSQPAPEVAA